ncbi:PH domain-containing protein [Trichostrongylus colubriformis]|uniref:PH domain-containing protein n=1 Tax=Trichostrongylus colubriformis TaxID=6319 RepID=A0AAN8FYM3_TRICO
MLANASSLYRLAADPSFERRFAANLQLQQDFRWRPCFAVLKANLLFVFNKQDDTEPPFLLLVIEDCFIELCDENKLGKDFTFEVKYKTTGRSFIFAAENFKALERQRVIKKKLALSVMPAYHSKIEPELLVANMALLPLRTNFKGPAPRTDAEVDIIDEALMYFKPNIFFREFEIKGPSDRTLIYLTLYITECLRKLQRSPNKISGQKDLAALALSHQLPIPGEADFPLNNMFKAPANKQEEETMRAYLQQMRQELGARLCELAFPDPSTKPSKWWLSFSRKRFMDKGLVSQGVIL